MTDYSFVKLGKLAPKIDKRTLKLAKYFKTLPPIPESVDYTINLKEIGMMANDRYGDCTCATAGHFIQVWTCNSGKQITLPDIEILKAYSAVTGFDPSDPTTDNGAYEIDVLNYWRTDGIGGHKILGYVGLDEKNAQHIKTAIYLFGGVYIGLGLPMSAANQHKWRVSLGGTEGDPTNGSWGGHAVGIHAYDRDGLTCITWGGLKRMTWGFWHTICDESYAIISEDWINKSTKLAPSGFNIDQLREDLKAIEG